DVCSSDLSMWCAASGTGTGNLMLGDLLCVVVTMVSVAAAGGSSSWYSFSAAAAVAVTWAATAVAAAMAVATTAAAAATTAAAKKRTYPLGGEGTPLRPWRLSGVGEYQLHRHVVLGVGQLLPESVGGTHGHGEPGIAL